MCEEMFLVPGEGQHPFSDPKYGDGSGVLRESLMLQDDVKQA